MKSIIYFLIIVSIFSCKTENKSAKTNINLSENKKNKSQKKDSLFVLHDIKDLNFIDNLNWDFENLYLNKSKTQKFKKLSSEDKIKFLFHFLKGEDGSEINKDCIIDDLQAFIVAKQTKINHFTPTIIKVYGTDFTAVILVNLDDEKNVISTFPIYNIENSGPAISEDTLIVTRPKIKCRFSKNSIQLYKLTGTSYPKNDNIQPLNIDSLTFKVTISNLGKFKMIKTDSIRYKKKCELDYFQSY